MILLGRYLSPFVRRVAATLELYGLPFENNPLQHTGDDAPKLRELNPVGRVPALILDDERIIVDSHMQFNITLHRARIKFQTIYT